MTIIPIMWNFKRGEGLLVLEIIGESINYKSENLLISEAVYIINKAEKYGAIPLVKPLNNINSIQPISVSFNLIFKSERSLNRFLDFITS